MITENGVALDVELRTLVGSQAVPYIYEDYTSNDSIADAILKMYNMTDEEKKALSIKVSKYAQSEFSYQKTVDEWDSTLSELIENWKDRYKRYEFFTF